MKGSAGCSKSFWVHRTQNPKSVLSTLSGRDPIILGEGLGLFDIPVPKSLNGTALKDSGILVRTGLSIIAVERNGVIDTTPGPDAVLKREERVIFIGSGAQRDSFRNVFGG